MSESITEILTNGEEWVAPLDCTIVVYTVSSPQPSNFSINKNGAKLVSFDTNEYYVSVNGGTANTSIPFCIPAGTKIKCTTDPSSVDTILITGWTV